MPRRAAVRRLVAHAAAIAATAMAMPVMTANGTPPPSIASPPANAPNAMPALTAEAGRADASGAPGPARLTTRYWIDGPVPMPNRPMPSTARATSHGFDPKTSRATSDTVTPIAPTIRAREAFVSANRPPPNEPIAVAAP